MKNLAAILLLAAGCTNNVTDGAFHVSGRVTHGTTHVIAAAAGEKTVVTHLDPEGVFDLALAPHHAWAIGFADIRKRGDAMLVGTLRSGTLDTLAPQGEGEVWLGDIDVAVGVATASVARGDLLAAMGLDEAAAAKIGAVDDLATRLVTPDADGDGRIDALEPGRDFALELYSDMHLMIGERAVAVADLTTTAAPVYGFSYSGTGIEVRMPATFQMSQMATATFAFDAPFYGAAQGTDITVVPAGMPIGAPALLTGKLDGHPIAAVYAQPGHDLPAGSYHFEARPTSLTFQNVMAPSDQALAAGNGLVMPFVRLVTTDASCEGDCTIDSIEYRWMERTAGGWQDASPALLSLMGSAHVSLVRVAPGGATQAITVELPTSSPTGAIAWSSASSPALLPYELAGVTTSQLCYVAAVYRDVVGTRLTSSATNPSLPCAGY
ncbi:MAG: hypothetical protein ACM31C_00945 [Acidobacteriota bacterium]